LFSVVAIARTPLLLSLYSLRTTGHIIQKLPRSTHSTKSATSQFIQTALNPKELPTQSQPLPTSLANEVTAITLKIPNMLYKHAHDSYKKRPNIRPFLLHAPAISCGTQKKMKRAWNFDLEQSAYTCQHIQ